MAQRLTNATRKKIEKAAKEKAEPIAKKIALEARDRISRKYLDIITKFYSTYEPEYYVRHFSERYEDKYLKNEGLGRSFSYLFDDRGRDRGYYVGGISISPDAMHTDYNGTPTQVLLSFLSGWRGLPPYSKNGVYYDGFESGVFPYYEIWQFRNDLVKELNDRFK